jgi:hypothetical protein
MRALVFIGLMSIAFDLEAESWNCIAEATAAITLQPPYQSESSVSGRNYKVFCDTENKKCYVSVDKWEPDQLLDCNISGNSRYIGCKSSLGRRYEIKEHFSYEDIHLDRVRRDFTVRSVWRSSTGQENHRDWERGDQTWLAIETGACTASGSHEEMEELRNLKEIWTVKAPPDD